MFLNGAVAKMSIANSNKRSQRPASLYYAVARCVTDVRAVCRMNSGNPGGKVPRSHPAFEDDFTGCCKIA